MSRPSVLRPAILAGLLACSLAWPAGAGAASLDISGSYRARVLAYSNLNLDAAIPNSHNFLSNDARLGLAARRIYLDTWRGEEMTMDVAVGLRALGVAGSTAVFQAPFDRVADHYPNTTFVPFLEKAALELRSFFGLPMDVTMGRQNYRLSSGLLLDDDGAGLTGVTARGRLPWWGMSMEGFFFSARNSQVGPNNLTLYGASIAIPGEGTWQFNQLFEDDRQNQLQYACSFPGMPNTGCRAYRTTRMFPSVRYQLHFGPIVFDGEAAFQLGKARIVPDPAGAPKRVTFDGNAQVMRAKWKQRLYRTGEGIARMTVARGSGDNPGTTDIDEAFFPSMGHRFDGLERSGFGDFFGASPYDAFGGNYSTTTANGLNRLASGIVAVGAGYTFPSYKGFALDVDYWLFQADRIVQGKRTLGGEWDFKLRYNVRDIFSMSASAALFGVGTASHQALGRARKYAFEVFGKF
ncbi:MAG: hypothetical protein HY927_02840 [Elusimicrobia bacterium]|nr:hypothetical protein [Elusimicrobiota bacterium]